MKRVTIFPAILIFTAACSAPPTAISEAARSDAAATSPSPGPSAQPAPATPGPVPGGSEVADGGTAPSPVDSGAVDAAPIILTATDAGTTSFEVVGPNLCAERSGYLVDCAFPPLEIESGGAAAGEAVDSLFSATTSGNCSSQYPLVLLLHADGAPDFIFHLEDKNAVLRRTDSMAIETALVTDHSPWTQFAAYDASCRVVVSVQMNVAPTP